jgi:hypothetical protein
MDGLLVKLLNGVPLLTLRGVDGNELVGVLTNGMKAGRGHGAGTRGARLFWFIGGLGG